MVLELWQRIMPILVVPIVAFFLIRPIKIRIPCCGPCKAKRKRWTFPLSLATVPPVCVAFLLACGSINWDDMYVGIVGNSNKQPYGIIILFFSLAYLCLSLDVTGLFEYIALKAIMWSKGSASKLFVAMALLAGVLSVVTSNDIVVLTLTPIIVALTDFAKVDPMPFQMVQFVSSNVWAMTLIVGSPTNIIVAQAARLSFLEYSKWLTLPAIVGGVSSVVFTWLRFRHRIPAAIKPFTVDAVLFIRDKIGAIFGIVCLFTCLVLLIVSTWLDPLPMWGICVIFGGLMLIKDIVHDIKHGKVLFESPSDTLERLLKEEKEKGIQKISDKVKDLTEAREDKEEIDSEKEAGEETDSEKEAEIKSNSEEEKEKEKEKAKEKEKESEGEEEKEKATEPVEVVEKKKRRKKKREAKDKDIGSSTELPQLRNDTNMVDLSFSTVNKSALVPLEKKPSSKREKGSEKESEERAKEGEEEEGETVQVEEGKEVAVDIETSPTSQSKTHSKRRKHRHSKRHHHHRRSRTEKESKGEGGGKEEEKEEDSVPTVRSDALNTELTVSFSATQEGDTLIQHRNDPSRHEGDGSEENSQDQQNQKAEIVIGGAIEPDPEEEEEEVEEKLKKPKMRYQTIEVGLRLPWTIAPFLFSIFIIVEALRVAGWTAEIARGFAAAISSEDSAGSYAIASFLFTAGSAVAAAIINDQPMTVLFSTIVLDPAMATLPQRSYFASLFSLAAGSNLGPCLTLPGSLAGIMWASILKAKGHPVSYWQFLLFCLVITPPTIALVGAVFAFETAVFPL